MQFVVLITCVFEYGICNNIRTGYFVAAKAKTFGQFDSYLPAFDPFIIFRQNLPPVFCDFVFYSKTARNIRIILNPYKIGDFLRIFTHCSNSGKDNKSFLFFNFFL